VPDVRKLDALSAQAPLALALYPLAPTDQVRWA